MRLLWLRLSSPALCSEVHCRCSRAGTGKRQLKRCASRTPGGEAPAFMQLEGLRSPRRKLLDHVVVLGQQHLIRLVNSHIRYCHEDRCHLGLRGTHAGREARDAQAVISREGGRFGGRSGCWDRRVDLARLARQAVPDHRSELRVGPGPITQPELQPGLACSSGCGRPRADRRAAPARRASPRTACGRDRS